MPRQARIKSNTAIYHIMARSISEIDLFKDDEDKKKYLYIIKDYQKIYSFKVYAYCLMDNHLHIIIDSNGADISKIMHSINFKYASYFNRKHNRHGHLFQDRFKSKIVFNERYLFTLTAYIHNNPSSLPGYENSIENYSFSSLGVYLKLRNDVFQIIDYRFIQNLFGLFFNKSEMKYIKLVLESTYLIAEEEAEFENEPTEYRSERRILNRDFMVEDIIEFVARYMNISKSNLHAKYNKNVVNARALLVLMLRNLCNSSCKDICGIIGNITQSRVSRLSFIGKDLVTFDKKYKNIVYDFIDNCS
ncbi:transposase [Candidatus Clostridium stratigraminis]|uniref:Transposase n=1 Tax=Candidatus Clostridium stratigraminis TaxID=3381661 RepID=A0ABW8SZF4_9CLOT